MKRRLEKHIYHFNGFSSFTDDKAALIWRDVYFDRFFRYIPHATQSASSQVEIATECSSSGSSYDFIQHISADSASKTKSKWITPKHYLHTSSQKLWTLGYGIATTCRQTFQ